MLSFYPVLCQYMKENNVTYRDLASITNNNIIALHLKMLGIKRWKLTEVVRICCFFHTRNAERMFTRKLCFVRSRTLWHITNRKSIEFSERFENLCAKFAVVFLVTAVALMHPTPQAYLYVLAADVIYMTATITTIFLANNFAQNV